MTDMRPLIAGMPAGIIAFQFRGDLGDELATYSIEDHSNVAHAPAPYLGPSRMASMSSCAAWVNQPDQARIGSSFSPLAKAFSDVTQMPSALTCANKRPPLEGRRIERAQPEASCQTAMASGHGQQACCTLLIVAAPEQIRRPGEIFIRVANMRHFPVQDRRHPSRRHPASSFRCDSPHARLTDAARAAADDAPDDGSPLLRPVAASTGILSGFHSSNSPALGASTVSGSGCLCLRFSEG